MSRLFSPWTLRGIVLRNRIVVSPMCQYMAEEGVAGEWHHVHLGSRAVGGAGMVIVEASAVSPEGRISPGDLGLWNKEQEEALRPIAAFMRSQGAVPGIQIAHAGRKASTASPFRGGRFLSPGEGGWRTLAPSALPFGAYGVPEELDEAGITTLREAFAGSAVRAASAGFEYLEIHMAHGYLLQASGSSPKSFRASPGFLREPVLFFQDGQSASGDEESPSLQDLRCPRSGRKSFGGERSPSRALRRRPVPSSESPFPREVHTGPERLFWPGTGPARHFRKENASPKMPSNRWVVAGGTQGLPCISPEFKV